MAAAVACFLAVATAAAATGGAAPVLKGDHFVYSDGTRVRAADPSGRTGTASRDGTIRYSDGTSVSHVRALSLAGAS